MLNSTSKIVVAVLLTAAFLLSQSGTEFTVTESPGATGGRDFTVRNIRNVPLTGLTVKAVDYLGQRPTIATIIYDSLSNGPSQPALKQGESHTWHFVKDAPGVRPAEYSVDAATYADGLAIGEPTAIQSLWDRRQWTAVALRQAFQTLDSSVPDIENTEEAVSILKPFYDQQLAPGIAREKRDSFMNAYGTLIAALNLVADLRAKGKTDSAADRIAGLRKWADGKIGAIQSQIRPVQVSQTEVGQTPR